MTMPPASNPNEFASDDELLRRIPHWQHDHVKGIHSNAFMNDKLPTGGISDRFSVNLGRLATVNETLRGHPGFGVAGLTVEACRSLHS